MQNLRQKHIQKLKQYFTPGKIVPSYGGQDLVMRFEENPVNHWSDWLVYVKEVDSRGNIIGQERSHCTAPDLKIN